MYMDNEKNLEEYVLSQDGIIFRGSYKYPKPTPWNFGQVPTPTAAPSASLYHTYNHSDVPALNQSDEGVKIILIK